MCLYVFVVMHSPELPHPKGQYDAISMSWLWSLNSTSNQTKMLWFCVVALTS